MALQGEIKKIIYPSTDLKSINNEIKNKINCLFNFGDLSATGRNLHG